MVITTLTLTLLLTGAAAAHELPGPHAHPHGDWLRSTRPARRGWRSRRACAFAAPRRSPFAGREQVIPGEILPADGDLVLNDGADSVTLIVANRGDRPIQVGSHYHFFETNRRSTLTAPAARGMRLDIAAGTAVRFEPGQKREVRLVPFGGRREVYGFNGKVMGKL